MALVSIDERVGAEVSIKEEANAHPGAENWHCVDLTPSFLSDDEGLYDFGALLCPDIFERDFQDIGARGDVRQEDVSH
jgi:hypothetical protein